MQILIRALRRPIAADRRSVDSAAARLSSCRHQTAQRRRKVGALLHDRLTSQETLIFTFDAGLVLGMLAPQSRRDAPPAARRPVTHNRALRSLLRTARQIAVRQTIGAVAPGPSSL